MEVVGGVVAVRIFVVVPRVLGPNGMKDMAVEETLEWTLEYRRGRRWNKKQIGLFHLFKKTLFG